jgi:GH24 family phage-related lysozyme (muramidase)
MAALDHLASIGVPLLASVLGGPPGLAVGAISLVTKALGMSDNSSVDDIVKKTQVDPDTVVKLRGLEVSYQQYLASVRLQMDQAEYADRANARSREVDITKVTGKKDWYPSVLGSIVVLGFTLIICALIYYPPDKSNKKQDYTSLINVLVGALAAGYSTVLGYYFGSSSGSRSKDQVVANLSSNLAEAQSTLLSSPPSPPLLPSSSSSSTAPPSPPPVPTSPSSSEPPAPPSPLPAPTSPSSPEPPLPPSPLPAPAKPASFVPPSSTRLMPVEVAQLNHPFEGCRLEAYHDPDTGAEPITIGWGSTSYKNGLPIRMGDKITQAEADDLYEYNCYHKFWKVLEATIPYWQDMNSKQKAALCSFAYNNGPMFFGSGKCDTLDAHLRNRRWEQVPGAMMMYRNPGKGVEVGLGRRRRAEGLVWIGGDPSKAYEQAHREINTPADCIRLEQQLKANPPAMAVAQFVTPLPPRPNPLGIWIPPPGVTDFTIPVKHYTQIDNTGGRGDRECFKTSCTMLADYVTKGKLSKLQKERGLAEPEDVYQTFMAGDTTMADTHEHALKQLGIDAYFTRTASIADVEKSLDLGIPVPIGVKYKTDGHWVLVNGRGPKGWDVLCPYGIRNGATDTWIQVFQKESDASQDSFSKGLLKAVFTDLGDEDGWAIFVTAVDGISTGVPKKL